MAVSHRRLSRGYRFVAFASSQRARVSADMPRPPTGTSVARGQRSVETPPDTALAARGRFTQCEALHSGRPMPCYVSNETPTCGSRRRPPTAGRTWFHFRWHGTAYTYSLRPHPSRRRLATLPRLANAKPRLTALMMSSSSMPMSRSSTSRAPTPKRPHDMSNGSAGIRPTSPVSGHSSFLSQEPFERGAVSTRSPAERSCVTASGPMGRPANS